MDKIDPVLVFKKIKSIENKLDTIHNLTEQTSQIIKRENMSIISELESIYEIIFSRDKNDSDS